MHYIRELQSRLELNSIFPLKERENLDSLIQNSGEKKGRIKIQKKKTRTKFLKLQDQDALFKDRVTAPDPKSSGYHESESNSKETDKKEQIIGITN